METTSSTRTHLGRFRARAAVLFPRARDRRSHPRATGDPDRPAPPAPLGLRRRARLVVGERLTGWCGMQARTVVALAVLLLAACGFAVHHFLTGRPTSVVAAETTPATPTATGHATPQAASGDAPTAAGDEHGAEVVVDVAGEVRTPGVYTLPAGARVADAVEAAGGSRPGTDTEALNRARLLVDGEQVLVGVTPTAPPPATDPEAAGTAPVSLNTATVEQLDALPGIGPVLAANIVAFREENGGFTSVEQLVDVSGIGASRLAELRDHVTL